MLSTKIQKCLSLFLLSASVTVITPGIQSQSIDGKSDTASVWTLKKIDGVTTLFHNDKPMILNMVYSEDVKNPKNTTCLSQVFSREAGVKAYQLPTDVDWEPMDIQKRVHEENLINRISLLLKDSPDAYIMVRILLWPPKNWVQKYPEHMVWNEAGKIADRKEDAHPAVSILSDFYIEKAAEAVERIVAAVEKSKYAGRVMGYMPCIGWSGESNAYRDRDSIADYSPAAKEAFRNYLIKKYGSVEKINNALGTGFKDTAEISVPSEKDFPADMKKCFLTPKESRFIREYYVFTEEVLADNLIKICHAAKKNGPGKLTGTFYGQVIQAGQWGVREHLTYGRYFWKKLASSPDFDFVTTPSFYKYAGVNHPLMMQSLLSSINLYGKAFIIEYDRPTHLLCYLPMLAVSWYVGGGDGLTYVDEIAEKEFKEKEELYKKNREIDYGKNFRDFFTEKEKQGNSAFKLIPSLDRVPCSMQETVNNIRRYTAFCVTKPTIGLWWWDQEGTRRKTIGGMAFNHPVLMQEIKKTGEIFDKAVTMNRSSRAEVAVFYDNTSIFYRVPAKGRDYIADAFVVNSMMMAESGIPFDEYFFDEIEDIPNIDQYKMVVFLNSNYVTTERRKWITEKLKKNGKTLIWFFASGLIDENGIKTTNIEGLTGIKVKEETDPELMACSINRFSNTLISSIPEKYQAFGNLELSKLYSPWYSVDDPQAVIMGKSIINKKTVFAMKKFPSWNSVVMPTGPIPVPVFRALAKMTGIHLYTEKENVIVYAAKDLMTIHTYRDQKGELIINLPPDVSGCTDMYSGERYSIESGHIKVNVDGFTVKLLHLENK